MNSFLSTSLKFTLVAALTLNSAANALTLGISDPRASPRETWTVGNTGQTVTYTFDIGFNSHKLVMFQQSNATNEYSSKNLGASPDNSPATASVGIPVTGQGTATTVVVTIQVLAYDMMGDQIGSASVDIDVFRGL